MPRDDLLKGRTSLPHHAYHVTTCTEGRRPIFRDFASARMLIAEMRSLHEEGRVSSLAWVVMPDHLHWLFQLGECDTLASIVKRLKARSAITIGRFIGRGQPLWQRGYYDHAVRRDEELQTMARYIVANPLRAGLVKNIGDYPLWDAIWL